MRIITVEDYNKALQELQDSGVNQFDVVILDRLTDILQEYVIDTEDLIK